MLKDVWFQNVFERLITKTHYSNVFFCNGESRCGILGDGNGMVTERQRNRYGHGIKMGKELLVYGVLNRKYSYKLEFETPWYTQ